MLTVPNTIKTLFKSDNIFKNFRVHFPNGEHTDLTNADIVAESVSFTESVCSKEVFQFGLSERSSIQFECVGVPNIYGVTIECGIEIDTSSLSAADISAIESDPGDGVLVKAADSDIGFGFYRVPYGVFIVESCPRSQGAMKHRRVTAYSTSGQGAELSPFLSSKLSSNVVTSDTITQNVLCLIAGEKNSVDGIATTETTMTLSTGSGALAYAPIGPNNEYSVVATYNMQFVEFVGYNDPAAVYRATCSSITTTILDELIEDMEAVGIDASYVLKNTVPAFLPCVQYREIFSGGGSNVDYVEYETDSGFIYPYMPMSGTGSVMILFPTKINTFELWKTSTWTRVKDYGAQATVCSGATLKKYALTDADDIALNIQLEKTGETINSDTDAKTFINSLNYSALYDGYLELFGKFGKIGRDGTIQETTLDQSAPVAVDPSEYSELWWDEYTVEQVGSIVYGYYDAAENISQTYQMETGLGGGSVYQMTNNYLLNSIITGGVDSEAIRAAVEGLIRSDFVPQLPAVQFIPITLEAMGLPYLEAGDYLEIDDADGGTVGSYILTRTLNGIQTLTDSIESKGGEVLGDG